ncbi:MAG: ABC transporter permease [Anaerolineae bacterium]|nr:ABC transporter permease [Anaerolineae bacterium]MBT7326898.1 ABC transporter permease [Anaerolineae bacterium]
MRHNRLSILGVIIILFLILFSFIGDSIAPYDPVAMDISARLQPPSSEHVFGTDDFGRDVFSRVIVATKVSLKVGVISVGISLTLGTILGAISGYYGGWLDEIIMRIMDILFAFPAILLAIAILAALGPGVENAMIAIGIVYTPIFARITRGSVITVREEVYVDAARCIGANDARIIFFHILPNVIAPIIVETTLSLAFAILSEAALSFLGLGTQPPDPSWGRMLSESRGFIQGAPWLGIFPGLVIMLTVMGFNFLGDGLRDALDPQMRDVLESRSTN